MKRQAIGLLVMATALFLGGLHALGSVPWLNIDWGDPIGWINETNPEDVVAAFVRTIGLAAGYWVLGTTVIYGLTSGVTGGRPRWVSIITFPPIRRLVDRGLAATLATSLIAVPVTPALADPPVTPMVYETGSDGIPVPHVRADASSERELVRVVGPAPSIPPPIPVAGSSSNNENGATHVVVRGDNLWSIADAHLESVLNRRPEPDAVTEYWLRVVTANRPTLRSGDPNLIYPGEVIALPGVDESR